VEDAIKNSPGSPREIDATKPEQLAKTAVVRADDVLVVYATT